MDILGVIPARYASTRFPGKPLTRIGSKTMIQHVYEGATGSKLLKEVVVATDDERIFNEVKAFGGLAVMTDTVHQSGTSRCVEAAEKYPHKIDAVINIQGDEPLVAHEHIRLLVELLRGGSRIASLAKRIASMHELTNNNIVKVVMDEKREALYFSRHPIPFVRSLPMERWLDTHVFYKHIGMYAYSLEALKEISTLEASVLEQAESLEQLRWLANGMAIRMAITDIESIGIDSPEDLKKIENLF